MKSWGEIDDVLRIRSRAVAQAFLKEGGEEHWRWEAGKAATFVQLEDFSWRLLVAADWPLLQGHSIGMHGCFI